MNKFRTHKCNELRKEKVGHEVTLAGWINKKRDHGNLLFIDLRDNYGITQCIIDKDNSNFAELEKVQLETVIKIDGKVVDRTNDTINKDIETGEIHEFTNEEIENIQRTIANSLGYELVDHRLELYGIKIKNITASYPY